MKVLGILALRLIRRFIKKIMEKKVVLEKDYLKINLVITMIIVMNITMIIVMKIAMIIVMNITVIIAIIIVMTK
jgi:hypothetical protein